MEKINIYNLLTHINNNDKIINYNINIDRLKDTKKTYINMYFFIIRLNKYNNSNEEINKKINSIDYSKNLVFKIYLVYN